MNIQRGDRVYYRGEVWIVTAIDTDFYGRPEIEIKRPTLYGGHYVRDVSPKDVQCVEQVR